MSDAQRRDAAQAFYDKMRQRHSVRDYIDRPVPRDVIEACIRTAGSAPSGANHQPWHFVAVSNPALKQRIRAEAEEEERRFYEGGGGDEWIKALEPIGTTADKPHLTIAPWLIIVFAQRWGEFDDGTRYKNYYVPESVNIATGFLLAALHHAGLAQLGAVRVTSRQSTVRYRGSDQPLPADDVFFPDAPAEPVKARIIFVGSVADAASDTLRIRVEIPNPSRRMAGERVRVEVSPQ